MQKKRGFTIIEVVLVLAIAGLIMAMVFIALPSLQRSQRTKQRKDDLGRILAAVSEYQKNNNGIAPWHNKTGHESYPEVHKMVERYIDDQVVFESDYSATASACGPEFRDPDGSCYRIWVAVNCSIGEQCSTSSGVLLDYNATDGNRTSWAGDTKHLVTFFPGTKCGEREWTFETTGSPNSVAVALVTEAKKLEGVQGWGGVDAEEGSMICVDNS